ncbi:MAG TPA: DUF6689 family protein [Candidatus Polarisedimenticolia bacterium]|jgi:streptogramin lyase
MLNVRRISGIGALLILAAVGTAAAEVYVTSPTTGRILVLNSSGALVRSIGGAGGLAEPYAIVLDSQRNLLVTDYAAGRIVSYTTDGSNASVVASNIPKADGLSVGPGGDLFLVSRDNSRTQLTKLRDGEESSGYLHQVWMVPAGSTLPLKIGDVEESFRLAQTLVLSAGPYKGDLLVLSTRPGLIARYRMVGPATFDRSADLVSYVPGEPTSMAATRTGDLLVSTSDGRILRFSNTGVRLQGDFASGLPAGPTRISVNGDGVVHLTRQGSSSVVRFDPYAARLPDLNGATSPVAAAITNGCVPTPTGSAVSVSPAAGVTVTFDHVVVGGETCLQTTALGAGVMTSPGGNTIPSFARKLWEDAGFVVYDVTTTAAFTDSAAVDLFSNNPDARVLVAHGTGQVFGDATTLVTPTDPRARTGTFSEFIVYLDTRINTDVVALKLHALDEYVSVKACQIADIQLAALRSMVGDITNLIESAEWRSGTDKAGTIAALQEFKSYVRAHSGDGISNTPGSQGQCNDAGNLLSLADTLVFQVSLL